MSTLVPPDADIFVRGAGLLPDGLLSIPSSCSGVTVDWRDEGVILTLDYPGGARSFEARSALVHEPQGRLYEALPLANFDAKAQRFWRRVFSLVHIPGGRFLLGILARRTRRHS